METLQIPLLTASAGLLHQLGTFGYQSMRAMYDPTNGDAVSSVGEISSLHALEGMQRAMMASINGRAILQHQPLVKDDFLEKARSMGADTFGHRYASYMDHNKFLPSGRTPVKHIADPTLAYIMTRYRQCHDFLHTLTGCGRTVEEELALKLLEFTHTGLPLGVLSIAGGAPHLRSEQRQKMIDVYWRWARENAPCEEHNKGHIPFYLNIMWEEVAEKPYEKVVELSGITPLKLFLEKNNISREKQIE